ncbi:hypothetical protein HBN50_00585 [Halobacteriovorax sp. GB3]|uniref:hypothetical protein n=1 Tax=Halobacteriovorax sp. GB3 TaxID=2719615 RepID=UPI00235E9E4B|nr:hypothetical protein [Halobacteriovorax sp. GB3]MDD0851562.1 hypothetical protein [Halobacteriovorax sp. GB3]
MSFSLLSASVFAETNYYEDVYLGQRSFDLYDGPLDPSIRFSPKNGSIHFQDDIFQEDYFQQLTEKNFFDLYDFWKSDVQIYKSCPNSDLGENIRYIRYVFRLLTISYLYEGLQDYQKLLYELGGREDSCNLEYESLFKGCRPESLEMKKFVRRVKSKLKMTTDFSAYKRMDSSELENWLKSFRAKPNMSLATTRLQSWCVDEGKDCRSLNDKEAQKAIISSCRQDKELIQKICSEDDQIYGLSYIEEAVSLIMQSNIINVLNSNNTAYSCLKRYQQIFSAKEKKVEHLKSLFPQVFKKLTSKKVTYIQGEIFLPGALKEFDDKGLKDFIFKEEEKVVEKKPEPKPVPKPLPKPVPKPIPKPVVVVKPKPKPVVIKEEPKKIELSTFEKAVAKSQKTKLARVAVEMDKMKSEKVFTGQMIEALKEPLKEYQTREALSDMKNYDKLGSKVEPVRFLFLRYLIDNDHHQGLYNIVNVLGKTFYVVNDIEEKNIPVYIELRNDATTSHMWQITVLQNP